jgi:hypothetical protein
VREFSVFGNRYNKEQILSIDNKFDSNKKYWIDGYIEKDDVNEKYGTQKIDIIKLMNNYKFFIQSKKKNEKEGCKGKKQKKDTKHKRKYNKIKEVSYI